MNSFAKSLVKHFCLASAGLLGAASTAALADDGWLPNMVHYINNGTPVVTPAPSIVVPESNYSDSVSLDWPSFGGENYVYLLEYTVAGSNDWQALYQGGQSYFESGEDFASGNYEFRIACGEFAGCPGGGYVSGNMEVVQKSGYVNAEFDHATASVHVYWGETENNQGYLLEQSSDGGNSWQVIEPQTSEKIAYQGSDYSGDLHTRTSVNLSSEVVAQGVETSNVLQQMKLAKSSLLKSTSGDTQTSIQASSFQSGTSLQYRVKTCVENFCGNSTLSKLLTIGELNPVLNDPGFETQQNLFTDKVGAEFTINSTTPINGSYSLDLALSNYGIGYYIHDYNAIYGGNVNNYPVMNGVTLSGKLRINNLSKGDSISVYPVAYYEGTDTRVEGQKQTFVSTDAGQEFDLFGRLWLDNTLGDASRIKRIYFLVRLLGSGQANVTLDDVQLYEGSGLAQTDPTLSAYMVDYDGLGIRLNWPAFLPESTNSRYKLEYKEQKSANWTTLYQGTGTEFRTSETQALATGVYQFRVACESRSIGSCPENGYVEATTVVVREPEHITAKINPDNGTTLVDWTDTVSSYGYVLEQSINNGTWTEITPVAGDPQRVYNASSGNYSGILHTQASKTLSFVATANDRFRVKACNSTRCGEWRTSSGVYNYDAIPMAVTGFAADRTTINHGESVNMWWQRPANYSKDFTYTITATRPKEATIPWVDGLTGHAITRGGLTGIQRSGTQTLHIKACNAYGCAADEVDLAITVQGPPAAPWNFAVDKPVVGLGETVKLSWEMHQNYLLPVTYELYVKKPDRTGKDKITNYTGGEYFNRTINKVGEHIFYVRACDAVEGCGPFSELSVNVGDIPVYQHSNTNLYLMVPQANGDKLIELHHNGSDWQVNELTQAEWDTINPTSLPVSSYQVNMADYNNNGLEDFMVISADQSVQIIVYSTGIFSIKTELLGAPAGGGK